MQFSKAEAERIRANARQIERLRVRVDALARDIAETKRECMERCKEVAASIERVRGMLVG